MTPATLLCCSVYSGSHHHCLPYKHCCTFYLHLRAAHTNSTLVAVTVVLD